jgi:nicotinamidase-related amidase
MADWAEAVSNTSGSRNVVFEVARTAVLAMDCQTGIVSIYAKPQDEFLNRAGSVVRAAREAGMTVIHVRVGFRPGLPEVSSRNKLFAGIKSSPQHQKLFEGERASVHPQLIDEQNDIVVTKHRVDAFAGTDLQMLLRARDITTLVLFGIATSGVVLSTLPAARHRHDGGGIRRGRAGRSRACVTRSVGALPTAKTATREHGEGDKPG